MFLSVLIVLVSAYLAARNLLTPITDLKNALNKVAEGDLTSDLSSTRVDEIGLLNQEFSHMLDGMRERKKLASLHRKVLTLVKRELASRDLIWVFLQRFWKTL